MSTSPDIDHAHKSVIRSTLADAAPPRPLWSVILVRPETMTFILLVLAIIAGGQLSPYFLDIRYILDSFTLTAELSLLALILTLVIIAGEIDLSPASAMALSAYLFAYAMSFEWPMWICVAIAIGSGLVMGAINSILIIGLQLPSIIVTIGTLTLYRGLAQVIAGDKSIRVPEWYIGIDKVQILGLPAPDLIFILAALALAFLLGMTVWGRQIYQTGTNETAAIYAGIRTRRIKAILFLATGVIAAIAGMIFISRLGSVRYDLGIGGELQMVLMAMLGGTYIFGGRGTILGTFLAALLLSVISTGMTTANLLPATQLCVLGVLLVLSIIATNFIYSRTQR